MVRLIDPQEPAVPERLVGLPSNYNFELPKTIRTIRKIDAKKVTLQFPDGLLSYAPVLIDFIEGYSAAKCTILDDVVYGACCVDDQSLQCDLLIHYGHSCLIPVTEMSVRTLYIFVDIKIDTEHLKNILLKNFTGTAALVGTIQFNKSVHKLKRAINDDPSSHLKIVVPQAKPLSPGEVLGCTSPTIHEDNVIYIGDGRFHLESVMIRNSGKAFFKYCPFTRRMTRESYDFDEMIRIRREEIGKARKAQHMGVILGSLGRQGSKKIMEKVVDKLRSAGKTVYRIVVPEINSEILDTFSFVDAFVQISCPRLSIDWGAGYRKPLLTPFEVFYDGCGQYEMDYYAEAGRNPWQNYQ